MKKIYKRTSSKIFAGVASGIADYFNIDPVFVRALFVFGTLFGVGSFFLVYLILMFILPKDTELFGSEYPYSENPQNTNFTYFDYINNQNMYQNVTNAYYAINENENENENENYREYYNSFYSQNNELDNSNGSGSRVIFGVILILIGIVILANMFIPFFTFNTIFPILLMILGVYIIFGSKLRQK
jgi:phage shock protein PspC (stress-responsive transcriptional regulator)